MPRRPQEPHESVDFALRVVERAIKNAFIDNKNLKHSVDPDTGLNKPAYYLEQYPRTHDYVKSVLTGQAEFILEKLDEARRLAVDFSNIAEFSDEELQNELDRRRDAKNKLETPAAA